MSVEQKEREGETLEREKEKVGERGRKRKCTTDKKRCHFAYVRRIF